MLQRKQGRQLDQMSLNIDIATSTAIRWTGVSIAILQIIYLFGTVINNIFCQHQAPLYSMYTPAITILLTAMICLLLVNIVSLARRFMTRREGHIYVLSYYLSLIVFTLCVYNQNRDAVLTVLWIILLATTGIIYGRKRFTIGAIVMASSVGLGMWLVPYPTDRKAAMVIIILLSIFASYFFYRYREAGLVELKNYNLLKRRERLQTRRLRVVVNNLKDALISVGTDNIVRLYNSAALSLFDTNRDLIGVNADTIMPLCNENGDQVRLSDIIKGVRTDSEREDLLLVYDDGQKINLHLSILPIKNQFSVRKDQRIEGAIVIARDITKQKSLDDEKDEFISVVSHELRTPVAIAEGALSNLQFLIAHNADPETFSKTLDAAHNQVLYLGQMVNDLSTLSRAQRGVYMDNEDIDIETFMKSLEGKYTKSASERNLKYITKIGVKGKVVVPSMAIEEIMQNLITNAIKYTDKGSVTVGVAPVDGSKHHAKFYVQDTGIGISKSDMTHVFQRFWRSEDYRTRKTSGTGLGLHVVNQLAQKIGTNVVVHSELNKGSTFSFVLPVKK